MLISVHSHDKLKKLKLILPTDPFLHEDITTVYVTIGWNSFTVQKQHRLQENL